MTVITINLDDDHIEKAVAIARVLRLDSGENVSRSEVFRLAIERLHIEICKVAATVNPADTASTN